MKTHLIAIGNSRGIRIPKSMLEEVGLGNDVEMSVKKDAIVIEPVRSPRLGWAAAFARMAERGDDQLLDMGGVDADWDEVEWQW